MQMSLVYVGLVLLFVTVAPSAAQNIVQITIKNGTPNTISPAPGLYGTAALFGSTPVGNFSDFVIPSGESIVIKVQGLGTDPVPILRILASETHPAHSPYSSACGTRTTLPTGSLLPQTLVAASRPRCKATF